MLPIVVLDPALLAIPNVAENSADVELILGRVIEWARCVRDDSAVQLAQMSDTLDILSDANCFPSGPNIKALLDLFDLNHVYTAEEIRSAINNIFDRAQWVVDVIGFEVAACSNCITTPDVLGEYNDALLRTAGEKALSSITSTTTVARDSRLYDQTYFALGVPHSWVDPVRVRACVDDLVLSSTCDHICLPYTTIGEVRVVDEYERLVASLAPEQLWELALDSRVLHLAISLQALQILRSMHVGVNLASVPRFHVGSEFRSSLVAANAGPGQPFGGVVREACARLILGIPKYEEKLLFKSGGTKSKAKVAVTRADGCIGCRSHITKRHEALRVMYWKHPSKLIELANVGVKSMTEILEGIDQDRVTVSW